MNVSALRAATAAADAAAPATPAVAKAERWTAERILAVRAWTPKLRSLRISRPPGFRFTPGHYVRLGIDDGAGNIVWRPFSMVCGQDEAELEFVLVLVPGGEFSERLRPLAVGDAILIEKFGLGFLTLDQLAPGRDLWLLASGSGLGPFVSILRTPPLWRGFERIILAHSVRSAEELAYRDEIAALAAAPEAGSRLNYLPVVTREAHPWALHARIPQLLERGELQQHAGTELDVTHSRVMVCGNPELTREMRALLAARGFQSSRRGVPGQMAFEKYW